LTISSPALSVAQQTNPLTITPAVAQLPSIGIGTTAGPSFPVFIQNVGQNSIVINSITVAGSNASDFGVDASSCPLAPALLPPGGYCIPAISFTPSAVGPRVARLAVTVAGGSKQSGVLVGEGLAAVKALSFNVSDVSFPATALGLPVQLAPYAFVFATNTGTVPLNIQSVSLSSQQNFSISSTFCSGLLQPGTGCSTIVLFEPVSTGRHTTKLVVFDDAPGGKQSLPLTGIGTAATAQLQTYPAEIDFGNLALANPAQTPLTVQNTGSESITIKDIAVSGQNATDFSIAYNGCSPYPFSLAAGSQCPLDIQFAPAALGTRLGTLQIVDTAAGSPQPVPLVGAGVTPTRSLAIQGPVSFGLVLEGSTGYNGVYIENTGNTTLGAPSLAIQGSSPDFQVLYSSCGPLPPSSNCFVPLSFTPSRTSLETATLVATDTATGQRASTTLAGSGVPAGEALNTFSLFGFVPEPVGVTSPPTGVTFTNVSAAPVTIDSVAFSGPAKSDFTIVQNGCVRGTVLNAGAWCTLLLAFTPTAVGPRVAGLSISDSGDASPLEVPLGATGLTASKMISFIPATIDVGPQPVGTTASSSAIIGNTGNQPVKITRVSIQGRNASDWALTGNNCPIAPATLLPGQGCQATFQFTPSAAGKRMARLQVTDDAAGSPQSLELNGFGSTTVTPPVTFSPLSLDFGGQALGSSTQQSVSVFNGATYAVTLSKVSISGPNASDFKFANTCSSGVPAGTSCGVDVTFTPSVTGLRTAKLQITDAPNGVTTTIPLAGYGLSVAGSLTMTPNPAVFSQAVAVGYSASMNVTLTNTGTGNLTISKFAIRGTAAQDYGIQINGCPINPAPLAPNQPCTITILFAPTLTGIRVANLQLTDSTPGSPHTISLVGEGVKPVKTLQFNPTGIDFGTSPVGTGVFGILSVYNSGTAPVTFGTFGMSGPNAGDFSINANVCIGYTSSLDPGASCDIFFFFTPSATGVRNATFRVTSDALNSPGRVTLTGTGQ
jgi:hypothetical protein